MNGAVVWLCQKSVLFGSLSQSQARNQINCTSASSAAAAVIDDDDDMRASSTDPS